MPLVQEFVISVTDRRFYIYPEAIWRKVISQTFRKKRFMRKVPALFVVEIFQLRHENSHFTF